MFSSQNKAYNYAMSIFQFSSVVGLIQSFPTWKTSSHMQDTGPDYSTELIDQFSRKLSFTELSCMVNSTSRALLWLWWHLHLETLFCLEDYWRETWITLALELILATIYRQIILFCDDTDHKAHNKINVDVHYWLNLEQWTDRENIKCSITLY